MSYEALDLGIVRNPEHMPPLEVECLQCKGSGILEGKLGGWECDVCEGRGKVPTEFGKRILDFIYVHVKLQVK